MKRLCCALISSAALISAALPATAGAHGSLETCRPGAADRAWSVHDIVANRIAGCMLARHFAASFQRDVSGSDPARVRYTNHGSAYRFRVRYAYIRNRHGVSYRVQAYGQPYGVFVSFETGD
jgi:hypothetical protein